ncbi:MAG: hypothetical protein ACLFQK_03085 [Fibrobacterota bacterium]
MEKKDFEKIFKNLKDSASVGIRKMEIYGNILKLKIKITEQKKAEQECLRTMGREVLKSFSEGSEDKLASNDIILAQIEEIKNIQLKIATLKEEIDKSGEPEDNEEKHKDSDSEN